MRRQEGLARLFRTPRLWFTFAVPVRRLEFLASGALLVPLKYLTDASLYASVTDQPWTPLAYLHPLMSLRFGHLPPDVAWLPWIMAAWTVPFLWIGISMTVRRCLDAGLPPALAG